MASCDVGMEPRFDYRNRESVAEAVRQYFSANTLTGKALDSNWLCREDITPRTQPLLAGLDREEQLSRCGCGLPFPELMSGAKVLDVGCGAGTDSLILSQLVGTTGRVVGVDLCSNLVATARRFAERRNDDRIMFTCADVSDLLGQVKVTSHAPFTLAVANCSLNLVSDKSEALRQIAALLEQGGELYVCDVFVSHDVTDCMRNHPFTWAHCIGGAWRWQEFEERLAEAGFSSPRLVHCRPLEITKSLLQKIANVFNLSSLTADLRKLEAMSGFQLCAATYRAFKLAPHVRNSLDSSKDKVQVIFSPPEGSHEEKLRWDRNVTFRAGQPLLVCGQLAALLRHSRYATHFLFQKSTDSRDEGVLVEAHANPFLALSTTKSAQPKPTPPQHITKPAQPHCTPTLLKPINSPIISRCSMGGTCRQALPLTGLVQLNGGPSKEIAALLQSAPALKKLRDMVAQQGNRGCGYGGCD